MEKAKFGAAEVKAAKCQTRDQFLSLLSHMAVHLFFTHVFVGKMYALAMADFLHIRRIQSVGYGGENPIPLAHVRGLLKDRSIVQSSLVRAKAQDTLCYFTALARAEYLLRGLVGGSENDGGAWVTKKSAPETPKVSSIGSFLKLAKSYTEAMIANDLSPSESDDDDEESASITPVALWATPISAKHKPKKQRTEKPHKPAQEVRKDDEDDEEGQITFQGASVGQMDRDPDLHTKWVGLRVMYLDSRDAEPVLGEVTVGNHVCTVY